MDYMDKKKDIRELTSDELKSFLLERGEKAFRAKQIEEWLWKKGATRFDDMKNLSKPLRQLLNEHFSFQSITTNNFQLSKDGTLKAAFTTHDNHLVEGVLIPSRKRLTACLSSQIGCNLGCEFCATGQMGLSRNLKHWEIFEQLVILEKEALKYFDNKISNIVLMGMGEPLANYKEVLQAIHWMTNDKGLGMSPRRITLSTAGIASKIRQLAEDNPKIQLAVSLHTADNTKRNQLMPLNQSNDLKTLSEALQYYHEKTGNRITFEYILFRGVNDQLTDAKQLAAFCRPFPVKINVIEYNPVEGVKLNRSDDATTEAFVQFLEERNMIVNLRRSKGKDIDAACGQLANKTYHKQIIKTPNIKK